MQEVLEEVQGADLGTGDFQEAQEVIMIGLTGPARMVKVARTAARGIIEAAPDTDSMKKEAVHIAVQEHMTADVEEVIAQAMVVPVPMEGAINHILPLKWS